MNTVTLTQLYFYVGLLIECHGRHGAFAVLQIGLLGSQWSQWAPMQSSV